MVRRLLVLFVIMASMVFAQEAAVDSEMDIQEIAVKFQTLLEQKVQESDPDALEIMAKAQENNGNLEITFEQMVELVEKWSGTEIAVKIDGNAANPNFSPTYEGKPGAEIKLEMPEHNAELIFVDVVVDGHKGKFILDTGASHTVITDSFSRKTGLDKLVTSIDISGNMDKQTLNVVAVKVFEVNGVPYKDFSVAITPTAHLEKAFAKLDGIVGSNVLSCTAYTLDYASKRFACGLPEHVKKMKLANFMINTNRPCISVTIDGKPYDFILDSGATKSFLFTESYKGKTIEKQADIEVDINEKDQKRKKDLYAEPDEVMIAGTEIKSMIFKLKKQFEKENVLGVDFLKRYVVAVDTVNKKFYFQDAMEYRRMMTDAETEKAKTKEKAISEDK